MEELGGFKLLASALLRVDHIVVEELALPVEDRNLAAGAESGVDRHRRFATEGRGEEKLAKVVRKDADRLFVGPLFEEHPGFGLHCKTEKPLVRIFDGHAHLHRCRRCAMNK